MTNPGNTQGVAIKDLLWAKSGTANQPPVSLIGHMLDVAACMVALLETMSEHRRKQLYEALGDEGTHEMLLTITALHDIGKATPVFQSKWAPGKERIERESGLKVSTRYARSDPKHSVVSELIVTDFLCNTIRMPRARAKNLGAIIGAHHGTKQSTGLIDPGIDAWKEGGTPWLNGIAELINDVTTTIGWVPVNALPIISNDAFVKLAAAISVADWLGSAMPRRELGSSLQHYFAQRQADAREFLKSLHIAPVPRRSAPPIQAFLPRDTAGNPVGKARPLQEIVYALCRSAEKPITIVIEAPMGEGKTEAAFMAEALLAERCGHDGMYVALPTQATSNQMYQRVRRYLETRFAGEGVDLQLLHGGASLVKEYTDVIIHPNTTEDHAEGVHAAQWFMSKRRGFLSPYAVGTVDQALLGILHVKHGFVRLWGLSNKVVVIDEAHAYDAYTSDLMVRLVRWLRHLGASVVIMSATLPKATRHRLMNEDIATASSVKRGTSSHDEDVPYPRVFWTTSDTIQHATFQASRRVDISMREHDAEIEAVASLLLDQAKQAKCVVAIVNTVDRAQELYENVSKNDDHVPVDLFHARYPALWRQEIEEHVLKLYSRNGHRPDASILIATQVVEQSLDVDFDVMYTDLCPVDLLMQRLGRLHRHDRPNRRCQPEVFVGGLADYADVDRLESIGSGKVYDQAIILRTILALHAKRSLALPDDIDPLVQLVYGEDPMTEQAQTLSLEGTLTEAKAKYDVQQLKDEAIARDTCVPLPSEGGFLHAEPRTALIDDPDAIGAPQVVAQTRLGEESVVIIPLLRNGNLLESLLGQPVTKSTLGDIARELRTTAVRLSPPWTFDEGLLPDGLAEAWKRQALLSGTVPLVFEHRTARYGRSTLTLSKELGIRKTIS
jgi:CRISPR-associated endonuclease/helicase Cas3